MFLILILLGGSKIEMISSAYIYLNVVYAKHEDTLNMCVCHPDFIIFYIFSKQNKYNKFLKNYQEWIFPCSLI